MKPDYWKRLADTARRAPVEQNRHRAQGEARRGQDGETPLADEARYGNPVRPPPPPLRAPSPEWCAVAERSR